MVARRTQHVALTNVAISCVEMFNDRNISAKDIAALLGATCCERLATMLQRVADMLGVENRTTSHVPTQHCCSNLVKRLQYYATSSNGAWKICHQHPTCRNTSQQGGQTVLPDMLR